MLAVDPTAASGASRIARLTRLGLHVRLPEANDATLKQRVSDLRLDLVSAPTDKIKVLSAAVPARAVPTH